MIRNIDRIRQMSLEELAPLLIRSVWISKNFNHNQGHISLRKVEWLYHIYDCNLCFIHYSIFINCNIIRWFISSGYVNNSNYFNLVWNEN